MAAPKHLWSGDWEAESASAAARSRRDRAPKAPPAAPERSTPAPARAPAPAQPVARAATVRAETRSPQLPAAVTYRRLLALGALVLVVIAGVAIAIGANDNGFPAAATRASAKPGWLGLQLNDWPGGGALVMLAIPGSPAQAAGLMPGDVIVQIDGRQISTAGDVNAALGGLRAGEAVTIEVDRGPFPESLQAKLGPRPANVLNP
jgi:S1-C subfamily serine protease